MMLVKRKRRHTRIAAFRLFMHEPTVPRWTEAMLGKAPEEYVEWILGNEAYEFHQIWQNLYRVHTLAMLVSVGSLLGLFFIFNFQGYKIHNAGEVV